MSLSKVAVSPETLKFLDNMNYLASVPDGEEIIGITVFQDNLYVATEHHLYKLCDNKRLELFKDD